MKKMLLVSLLVLSCGSVFSQNVHSNIETDNSAFEVFMSKKAPSGSILTGFSSQKNLPFEVCDRICSVTYFACMDENLPRPVCVGRYLACFHSIC